MTFVQLANMRREAEPRNHIGLSQLGTAASLKTYSVAAEQEEKRYNLGEVEQILLAKTGTDRANSIRNYIGETLGADLLTNSTNLGRVGPVLVQNLVQNETIAWAAASRGGHGNKLFARETLRICSEVGILDRWAQTNPDTLTATLTKALGQDTLVEAIRRGADPRTEALCAAVKTVRDLTEEEQFALIETNSISAHILVNSYLAYMDRNSNEFDAHQWLTHFGWLAHRCENKALLTGAVMRHKNTIVEAFDRAERTDERSYGREVVKPWNVSITYPETSNIFDGPLALLDQVSTRRMLWVAQLWAHTGTKPSADAAIAMMGQHPELFSLVLCGAPDGSDDEKLVGAGSVAAEKIGADQMGQHRYGYGGRQSEAEYRILRNVSLTSETLVGWIASGGFGEVGRDWLNNNFENNLPTPGAATIVAKNLSGELRGINFSTMEPEVSKTVAMNMPGVANYVSQCANRPDVCPPDVTEAFLSAWEATVGPDKWGALDTSLAKSDDKYSASGEELAAKVGPRRIIRRNKGTRGHNAGWNVDGP